MKTFNPAHTLSTRTDDVIPSPAVTRFPVDASWGFLGDTLGELGRAWFLEAGGTGGRPALIDVALRAPIITMPGFRFLTTSFVTSHME
jgi:hypothetical protein